MRALQSADTDLIRGNLDKYIDQFTERAAQGGKNWEHLIDKDEARVTLYRLLDDEHPYLNIWISDSGTHLFIGAVSPMWWSKKPWLLEQMFCRIRPGPVGNLWQELDDLGRDLGCAAIVFGTSLAKRDAALGRLLVRGGYTQESTQYIKEI